MKFFQLFFLLNLSATFILCTVFHYDENGADWADSSWQCLIGSSQSPINIQTASISANEKFQLTLKKAAGKSSVDIVNNGHSIQADYPWLEFEATNIQGQVKYFKAIQLHFHSPSEHSFDGALTDLEIHIVCQQTEGENNGYSIGVFTFVFSKGDGENSLIEPFSQAAATFASSSSTKTLTLDTNLYENINKALQGFNQLNYYTYQGSLTTPPCTQIVEFYIIKQALPISVAQLKNFQDLWGNNHDFAEGKGNNRQTNPLNGRSIVLGNVQNKLEIYANRIAVSLLVLMSMFLIFFY